MEQGSLKNLGDAQLMDRLKTLVKKEYGNLVQILVHIGEVDRRRLYATKAYRSLFEFCLEELHFSESQAYLRINAARKAQKYPAILSMVEAGEIHLTAIAKLSPHLTADNHQDLLHGAMRKSKIQIEQMLADKFPKPDVPTSIRAMPVPRVKGGIERAEDVAPLGAEVRAPSTSGTPSKLKGNLGPSFFAEGKQARLQDRPPAEVAALSPGRVLVKFTASSLFCDKLQKAKDLLAHQVSNVDLPEILERALTMYVEALEKKKYATTARKKAESKNVGHPKVDQGRSSYIPNADKRQVYERDGGRCTFVSEDGRRCSATAMIEFDHIVPRAKGGKSTADQLRLLCKTHNLLMAEQEFGRDYVELRRQGFQLVQGVRGATSGPS